MSEDPRTDQPTDPQVDEQATPHSSPIEEEYRQDKPSSPEVREATTFLGLGAGGVFAILLGLFVVATAYFIFA